MSISGVQRGIRIRIVLVLFLVALCGTESFAKLPAADSLLNQQAPEFSRVDFNQRKVDLAALKGRVVLLNFWATWCAPCQMELPRFKEWQARYGAQGFQVLAISMDDSERPAKALARKSRLNFPVVLGDAELGKQYGGIFGLPVTFLIDRTGKIRFTQKVKQIWG
jgi:peroxiredoxin